MEEKGKFLNEGKYQKVKKGLIVVAIVVILIGLTLGGGLIFKGISQMSSVSKAQKLEESQQPEKLATMQAIAEKEKLALETQITDLETQIKDLTAKERKLKVANIDLQALKSKEFIDNRGFTDKYNEYSKQINLNNLTSRELFHQKGDLESELNSAKFKLEKGNFDISAEDLKLENEYNETKYSIEKTKGTAYIIPGVFIIVASFGIAGYILFIAFGRNVAGFVIQGARPIVKETIEEVVPEVGKAFGGAIKEMTPTMKEVVKEVAPMYGDVAKEISRGIKEGLKDEDKQE